MAELKWVNSSALYVFLTCSHISRRMSKADLDRDSFKIVSHQTVAFNVTFGAWISCLAPVVRRLKAWYVNSAHIEHRRWSHGVVSMGDQVGVKGLIIPIAVCLLSSFNYFIGLWYVSTTTLAMH